MKRGALRWVLLFSLVLAIVAQAGETRRYIDYIYDEAGRVVGVESEVVANPPVVSGLAPPFISVGGKITAVATGTDLRDAEVTASDPNLVVGSVTTTNTRVTFELTALENATPGTSTIVFTTFLGSDSETMDVLSESGLDVSTVPSPIVIAADGVPNAVDIVLSSSFADDHTFELLIADSGIALLSASTVVLPAGATNATIEVSGQAVGTTNLQIWSPSLSFIHSVPVYVVSRKFTGDGKSLALPVGVFVASGNELLPSPPVGVFLGTETAVPIVSPPVGVFFGEFAGSPIVSPPVGVVLADSLLTNLPAGVILGPLVQVIDPMVFGIDVTTELAVRGYNLQEVDTISFMPSDGLTVGSLTPDPGGAFVTAPLTVASDAPALVREVTVSTPAGEVRLLSGLTLEMRISDGPEVTSLNPATAQPGEDLTLIVEGVNLQGATAISADPPEGMTFTSVPVVNAEGTELSVALSIDPMAMGGERVITVETFVGTTQTDASTANTFTVGE